MRSVYERQKLEPNLLWRAFLIHTHEVKILPISVQDLRRICIHETLIDLHCVILAIREKVKEHLQAPLRLRRGPFRPKGIVLNPIVRLEEEVDSCLDC